MFCKWSKDPFLLFNLSEGFFSFLAAFCLFSSCSTDFTVRTSYDILKCPLKQQWLHKLFQAQKYSSSLDLTYTQRGNACKKGCVARHKVALRGKQSFFRVGEKIRWDTLLSFCPATVTNKPCFGMHMGTTCHMRSSPFLFSHSELCLEQFSVLKSQLLLPFTTQGTSY